jgi:acylphosphatase
MEATSRCIAYFSGFVQGVGFRYTTRSLASRLPVRGYVKNLVDGRVELIAEGSKADLETLLADVRSELGSNIHDADVRWDSATGEFQDFEIRL